MAKEIRPVDVSNTPQILALARRVKETGEPLVLTQDDQGLAVLTPLASGDEPRRPRQKRTGIITKDDSLWNIVGIGRSGGKGDISENKHKYLAEAYADRHE
jgi:antitoxin (DNA-binding transcriptional repressor) of toxin-antitoxin stability system